MAAKTAPVTVVNTDNTAVTCDFFMNSVVAPVRTRAHATDGGDWRPVLHRDDFTRIPASVRRRI
ncbi:hypothetical protein [Streptomyces qinglanensis]|uniref:hypothetical protein n=1 Tax=Streptomyces qinglanensis TaxID=943816 RepID=UPI003D7661E4